MTDEQNYEKFFNVRRIEDLYTKDKKIVKQFMVYSYPKKDEIPYAYEITNEEIEAMKISSSIINNGNKREFYNSMSGVLAIVTQIPVRGQCYGQVENVVGYANQLGRGDEVNFSIICNGATVNSIKCTEYIDGNDKKHVAEHQERQRGF